MKLIKAYIRTFLAEEVIAALKDLKAPRLTVLDAKALGDEIDSTQLQVSAELATTYTRMVKLELVCTEGSVERIKETIISHARTGHRGDGLIVVSPIDEAISIRTGRNGVLPIPDR